MSFDEADRIPDLGHRVSIGAGPYRPVITHRTATYRRYTRASMAFTEWPGATNAPADDWDGLLAGKGASLERLLRPVTA